jgi:tripartite-type tricarboxylate transporter receptor subunit TctC
MKRRDFLAGSGACALAAMTGKALAQSGPLTKIIFPFAAGGGGDALCRVLAQHIGPLLDRNVIVENRTGGDGLIGIKAVKGANPDGTTILVTTGPTMYLLPMVETTPSFDTAKDFVRSPSSRALSFASSSARPFRPPRSRISSSSWPG